MLFAYYVYDTHKNYVSYELVIEIPLPNEDFNPIFVGFNLVDSPQKLHFWLFDDAQHRKIEDAGLSDEDYSKLVQILDFDQYDYIITYHRKIDNLYWTRKERKELQIECDVKTPLEVELQEPYSGQMYIYRIFPKGQYISSPG